MSSRHFLQIKKHLHQHPRSVVLEGEKCRYSNMSLDWQVLRELHSFSHFSLNNIYSKIFFNKRDVEIKSNFHNSFHSRDVLLSPDFSALL